jgi:hypothetical protein
MLGLLVHGKGLKWNTEDIKWKYNAIFEELDKRELQDIKIGEILTIMKAAKKV